INSGGVAPDPSLYDKNLRYLTGLDSKQATLLLAPSGVIVDRWETKSGPEVGRGRRVNELLFTEKRTEREEFMDGAGSTFRDIQEQTGIDAVYDLSKMEQIVSEALMKEEVIWLNTPGNPKLSGPLPAEIAVINQMRERYYWLNFRNIAPKIHDLRWVKEPYEVECLRKAFAFHTEVFEKIMRTLKPGMNEALGQALFEFEVRQKPGEFTFGLDLYADAIIVAAGENSAIAHYMENDRQIKDGDLVLIDSGVACEGYYSDISVTFPANGRFTPRQRELYAIVLEAQKKAIATMKPGSSQLESHKAVYEHFEKHGFSKYGYGTCGHPVGLNIHDANGDPDKLYEPGVVVVIEPFLVIPEENTGIRIESGVLITENGPELLPCPPREIDELETLCQE
ncbi:MAG: Xaa-Pro peptidase family protein, partial [Candidatus Promineifilaceae bacterium]